MTTTEEQGLFNTGTFDNATFDSVQTDSSTSTIFSNNLTSRIFDVSSHSKTVFSDSFRNKIVVSRPTVSFNLEDLREIVRNFDRSDYEEETLREEALKYRYERYEREINEKIREAVENHG